MSTIQQNYEKNLGGTAFGTPLRYPVLFRENSGRVGDVGFIDHNGNWRWIRNAFDSQGLAEWDWPRPTVLEGEAVTEEGIGHFKIALGGNVKMEWKVGGTGVDISGAVTQLGVDVSGTLRLQRATQTASMSVLIPGHDPLLHRVCPDRHWWRLLEWFSAIEGRAWEAASAAWSGPGRPDKILLVTGQTLTTEYAICHQEHEQSGCEAIIEAAVSFPALIDGSVYLGHGCERVSASLGFESSATPHAARDEEHPERILHSIFFETMESFPMNRFPFDRPVLLSRVSAMFRYFKHISKSQSKHLHLLQNVEETPKRSDGTERQTPPNENRRVAMELGNECEWFLLQFAEDDFAVQFTGSDPGTRFPAYMDDEQLWGIVESLHDRMQHVLEIDTSEGVDSTPILNGHADMHGRSSLSVKDPICGQTMYEEKQSKHGFRTAISRFIRTQKQRAQTRAEIIPLIETSYAPTTSTATLPGTQSPEVLTDYSEGMNMKNSDVDHETTAQLDSFSDGERTEGRYNEAIEQLKNPVKLPRRNLETFEIPDFNALAKMKTRLFPHPALHSNMVGNGGAVFYSILAFLTIELIFLLSNYYEMYSVVFPDSRVAKNLSGRGGTAFTIFKWMICWLGAAFTVPAGIYLAIAGIKNVADGLGDSVGAGIACLVALPWIGACFFLGSWQIWIYWLGTAVWSNSVWNNACSGWDGYALLQGIQSMDVSASLPYVGTATVFLASGHYAMQLEQNNQFHNIYYFYNLSLGNVTPTYDNITYNTANNTFTINNLTSHFNGSPNLEFPTLDLVLKDKSIPFGGGCGFPNVNLIYQNGSTTSSVLSTVNTPNRDCTELKVCGNLEPQGDFEIVMGVVMIQQYLYGVCCTTPTSNSVTLDEVPTVSWMNLWWRNSVKIDRSSTPETGNS